VPIAVILELMLQIACGVHVVRTGRPSFWLWIILLAPGIGCTIYFFAEILPDLGGSRTARRAVSSVSRVVNAERDFRDLVRSVEDLPTAENRRLLAEALFQRGDLDGALAQFTAALSPPHQADPVLLMGLAKCQLARGEPSGALSALDKLQAENPGYQSQSGHLIYAMALEAADRLEEACSEYAALTPIFAGEEARIRYALLLTRLGRDSEARELYEATLRAAQRGARDYRQRNKEWIEQAKRAVSGV
jgi:hypothetical protein